MNTNYATPTPREQIAAETVIEHDDKGYSEEKCVRCGWVMGMSPLNCNNDNTPHCFPSQIDAAEQAAAQALTQKLYATTDGMVWAEEWCKIAREIEASDDGRQVIDEGWMVGWFANAIEIGRNAGRAGIAELEAALAATERAVKIAAAAYEDADRLASAAHGIKRGLARIDWGTELAERELFAALAAHAALRAAGEP